MRNIQGVHVATARSIDDWQEMMGVRPVEFLHSAERKGRNFRAQHRSVTLDDVSLSHVESSAHHVQRLARAGSSDVVPYMQIGLQLRGWSRTEHGNRSVLATPGDLLIFNTESGFRVELSDDMSAVLFLLPQPMLGLSCSIFERQAVHVIPGDSGLGLLMARMLGTIGEDLDSLTQRGGARVLSSAASLAAAMLLRAEEERESISAISFEDVCDYIDANIADPGLTAKSVADAHFIALRTLQYQLQREGTTVSRLIRERRLQRAKQNIADPLDKRPIAEIARNSGFVSAAHFSREFKLAFGVSPSEFRRAMDEQGFRSGLTSAN